MKTFDLKAVQAVNEKLQALDPQFLAASPQLCYEIAIWCCTQRSYIAEQCAIAKKNWMDRKRQAYLTLLASSEANKVNVEKFGVNVIKDYIGSTCGDLEARHELAERTFSALGSMEDVLRSVISAIKQELYSNR